MKGTKKEGGGRKEECLLGKDRGRRGRGTEEGRQIPLYLNQRLSDAHIDVHPIAVNCLLGSNIHMVFHRLVTPAFQEVGLFPPGY